MRRIVIALAGTVSGLIMLFSYHTSLAGGGTLAVPAGIGSSTTTSSGGSGSTSSGSGPSAGTTTVTGDEVQTRWGPVQVRITTSGGQITDVTAVLYPDANPHDQQINAYALPVLAREALAAQGADIDHVSGATVTSDGYVRSLQSALDQAHL